MENNNTLTASIERFSDLMKSAKENIIEASKIYVDMIDKYGDEAKLEFQNNNPCFPKMAWRSIEMIGRGTLYPKILFTRFLHDRRVRSLPYSEQKRICEDGVEYKTADNDCIKLRLDSMDDDQLSQVCNNGVIRSLPEQRSYIEAKKMREMISHPYTGNETYRLEKGKVHILIPCTISKRQLKGI